MAKPYLRGGRLPDRALALTVDDGYEDFAQAWPLFRRFDLPVTLFVVSGFVGSNHLALGRTWSISVARLPRFPVLNWSLPDGTVFTSSLASPEDRNTADHRIDQILIALPDARRRAVLTALPSAAGVALPAEIPVAYAPLSWQHLQDMAREGLEVGAHTIDHPILSRIESPAALRQEIQGSKERIEGAMAGPVLHFCYPNGQPDDYNASTRDAVRQAGFATAVNATRGLNRPGCDAVDLRRVGVDPSTPEPNVSDGCGGFSRPMKGVRVTHPDEADSIRQFLARVFRCGPRTLRR